MSGRRSIQKNLFLIIFQFVLVVVFMAVLAYLQSEIMSNVRSYVRAEGLYTKGHMLAIYHLQQYVNNGSEENIPLFERYIEIPKGDRMAREALQQKNPDLELAYQGFLQAKNDPRDIPGMIRLFLYFQNMPYLRDAIQIWTEADQLISELELTSHELINSVKQADLDAITTLLSEVEMLNHQLVAKEIEFSLAMTEGSHWMKSTLMLLTVVFLLILLSLAALLTRRFVRNISQIEAELEQHRFNLERLVDERTHKLENVLEGTNAGTWDWNLASGEVSVNEKWTGMLGYALDELAPVHFEFWESNLHPEDKDVATAMLQAHLEGERDYYDVEFRLLHKQGEWVWINARGKITERDDAGQPLRMSGTHIDISDKKVFELEREAARQDAENANREKSRFLANMSHELRTPMHAILNFSKLGLKKAHTEAIRNYLTKIHTSGVRLTRLLDDLLDLAKLEASKMQVDCEKLDMVDLTRECLSEVDSLIAAKGLNIELSGDQHVMAEVDRKLITQVIINLLSNAIKFSDSQALVQISLQQVLRDSRDCLLFSITDEGIGIPAEELDKIFDSFFQSTKTRSGGGGTGLGLPISRKIITLHEGEIWANSPPPGRERGSCFCFVIPLEHAGQNR